MTHLSGGPYYELSFLIANTPDPGATATAALRTVEEMRAVILVVEDPLKVAGKLADYAVGLPMDETDSSVTRVLDIDAIAQVAGRRKCRLFVKELSAEYTVLNLWFLGAKSPQANRPDDGIHDAEKPAFQNFFHRVREALTERLEVVAGTIAFDDDADSLFDCQQPYPHPDYSRRNLFIAHMQKVMVAPAYEYGWVSKTYFAWTGDAILCNRIR